MAYEWREVTDGTFKGFVFHVATPTKNFDTHGSASETIKSSRRIQKVVRPFQNGQKTRDMGADGDVVTETIIFFGLGYKRRFEDFQKVLNEGTSGTLVLPTREAINATFESMEESADADNGNSKTARVTWVQDEVSGDLIAFGAASGFIPKGLVDAVNSFNEAVEDVLSVIQNNPILATIRQLENITATAVNSVVLATSLPKAIRDRVLTTIANMESSLAVAQSSFNTLLGLFDTEEPGSPGAPGSGFEPGRVDPDTGQPLEDGLVDETVVEAEDPLAAPETEPDTVVEPRSLETVEGLEDYETELITLLQVSIETIQVDTVGRMQDISDATEDAILDIRDTIQAAKPSRSFQSADPTSPSVLGVASIQILTPVELSLPEIMFENGIELSTIDDILAKNTFLDDPNIVPANTVINL